MSAPIPQDRPLSWYFAHGTAAERYDVGRPRYHHQLLPLMRSVIGDQPRKLAVDVACGTGHSTVILPDLAQHVIGCDIAPAMLALAPSHPAIQWIEAPAESLPVNDHTVDLVTVTMAFHWFDQPRFLAEARRVLRDDGWLLLVSSGFKGEMIGRPAFNTWYREVLTPRYPAPARHAAGMQDGALRAAGLTLAAIESYQVEVTFTRNDLVAYFLTQSNFITRIESGEEAIENIAAWFDGQLAPFFPNGAETLAFGGAIQFIRPLRRPGGG